MNITSSCADLLTSAIQSRRAIARLTAAHPALTHDDAYLIQDELAARAIARGERIIGAKLGLTARAKQEQMNVSEPVYGQLLSGGVHVGDGPIEIGTLIHPRVEPEVVFIMGEDLGGPGVSRADVIMAASAVCAGLEVIDSRFSDFSFSAADVIADNTSAARTIVGSVAIPANSVDLGLLGVLLEVNGELVATACGAATVGHPADAVAMLANWLGARGRCLRAGWTVFSGGLTAAVPLERGTTITATFGHLGSITARGI